MSLRVVNIAPLGSSLMQKSTDGKSTMTPAWDAHFKDSVSNVMFDPQFEGLTLAMDSTLKGQGTKNYSTFDLVVDIKGQSSATLNTTILLLPYTAFTAGFLNVFDSTAGNNVHIGTAFIRAGENKAYMPTWVNKQNIALVGAYRVVAPTK